MNRKLKKLTKQKEAKDKQIKIYLMQSVALTNYSKLCIKLKEVPRKQIVETLANCENLKQLHDANKMYLLHLE